MIILILILMIILLLCYKSYINNTINTINKINTTQNLQSDNIQSDNIQSDNVMLEDDNLVFSDNYYTSIDTIDLYPNKYPYTFGYKPYYYRLYPYPLRPRYHYHKKNGIALY